MTKKIPAYQNILHIPNISDQHVLRTHDFTHVTRFYTHDTRRMEIHKHRTFKACSNEANIMQHCWQQCCMMLDGILSKFKIKLTPSNMVFKQGQHVASKNVG